jgi:hypothetical protein
MGLFSSTDRTARDAAVEKLRDGDASAAVAYNRRAQATAEPGRCGGCIGAGTGANCCMCGLPR